MNPDPCRSLRLIWLIALSISLVACTSSRIHIFDTKIDAQILASADTNPDENGRPSPIVIRVYALRSNAAFESVDFFTLYDDEATALGTELIVASEEIELAPGEQRAYQRKPGDEARYLGMVAAYRNFEQAIWRAVMPIESHHNNKLLIEVGRDSITIKNR